MVCGEEVLGFGLYRHHSACVVGVIEFDQETLRTVEMITEDNKDDGLGGLIVGCQLRVWMLAVLPLTTSKEGGGDEDDAGSCVAETLYEIEVQPTAFLFFVNRQRALDRLPDLLAVGGIAHGHSRRLDGCEILAERGVGFGAGVALAQVLLDDCGIRGFSVVVIDEFFFGEVLHAIVLSGARPRRSFWTALNTACLAALGAMWSAAAISSVERSSMWRRTKAVRSVAVRRCMARAWRASIS